MGKAWPAAKRGKARAAAQSRVTARRPAAAPSALKKPAAADQLGAPKNVPYVRHGAPTKRIRHAQATWARSLKDFVNTPAKTIINKLTRDKILPDWKGATCPYCGEGTLGPLKHYADSNGGWAYRCNSKECKRRVLPHAFHPIFKCGTGQSHVSLADQASVLFCSIAKCSQTSVRFLLQKNHKLTESIYESLHAVRAKSVVQHEKNIKFGADLPWADVEADEVDIAKGEDPNTDAATDKPVIWEQWGGMVQRGDQKSLVLFKLDPAKTKRRAPGPGPIRKRDWKPLAYKWVHQRNIILHTDGARSYKLKLEGVKHDWVVHAKKRVMVKGKWVWIKPKFTKITHHDVPDDSKPNKTKRIIDRIWGELRKHLGNKKTANTKALTNKIRSYQWLYWHRGEDLWLATGKMLEEAFLKEHCQ
ncbi:unnamed protein product [Prorocentrum cordatum]|uniref:ISXO2-like transposase domain-containing protein n=1 Tax=Prorocentrum cordatum TaxID=2364126 RepID=A0ABN9X586_9DINO|nr:unnamed protein product [Polarella glacialis]